MNNLTRLKIKTIFVIVAADLILVGMLIAQLVILSKSLNDNMSQKVSKSSVYIGASYDAKIKSMVCAVLVVG